MRRGAVLLYLAVLVYGLVVFAPKLVDARQDWSYLPDVASDQMIARAALDGSGIDQTLREMADRFGYPGDVADFVAPRTPAAAVSNLPLLLLPLGWLLPAVAVASVFAIIAVCWMMTQLADLPDWVGAAVAAALLSIPYIVRALAWGNNGYLVATAVIAAWWLADRRPGLAGGLLGWAIAVKLWPGLLLFVLGRRVAAFALGSAAVFTAVGLALPGVTVGAVVATITGGADSWIAHRSNVSLGGALAKRGIGHAALIGGAVGLALWGAVLRVTADRNVRVAVTVLTGLLVSPLSWMAYWLAAFPAVAVIIRRLGNRSDTNPPALLSPSHSTPAA